MHSCILKHANGMLSVEMSSFFGRRPLPSFSRCPSPVLVDASSLLPPFTKLYTGLDNIHLHVILLHGIPPLETRTICMLTVGKLKHLFPHETTITEYIFPNANGVVPL